MFIGLSKTIGKVGGFRIGIGQRITSKNAWWLIFAMVMYGMIKLAMYMVIASFWMIYAVFYGIWWCIKKLVFGIVKLFKKDNPNNVTPVSDYTQSYQTNSDTADNSETVDTLQVKPGESIWFCSKCGTQNGSSNNFCSKCGNKM